MRRLFTFWRIVAVLALALAAYVILIPDSDEPSGPHVARHEVSGVIVLDEKRDRLIAGLADDDSVKGLIVIVDSPGGTVTGSETLFEAIRKVAGKKPVVALMGELAASGGYLASIAADHIVARGNTLTGSIGVVKQEADVRGLMESLGVEVRLRRSDPFKASPDPFSATPAAVEAWEEEMIDEAHAWFRGLVGERRGLDGEALAAVTDGRVFTGRMALEAGLVDEIGGPDAARDWLTAQGVDSDLPVREAEVKREDRGLLWRLLGVRLPVEETASRLGLDRLTRGPRLFSLLE